MRRGSFVYTEGGTFPIAPPLTSTEGEIVLGVEILDQAGGEVTPQLG